MKSSSLPRLLALAATFVFVFLFLAPELAPAQAQSPDRPIPTTIRIAPDIYAGLVQAIKGRPADVLPGSRLLITSLDRRGGWAIATVALDPEQPDEGESILAHSTLALVRLSAGKWSGAVLGSSEYENLLTAAPPSLVGGQAKPFLRSPRFATQQNMVTAISTSLKWPFQAGQTWAYTQGRHGTANASIDLAPYSSIPASQRAVVAAAGGVVIRRCDDDVQSSVAIRHSTGGTNDEVTGYLHMNKNTVNRPTGSTIKQGETIGITYNSPIAYQPGRCGYSTGAHVHFSTGIIPSGSNSSSAITLVDFAGTVVSGWQLGTDNCFTKGSERRCVGADFLSDNSVTPSPPTVPSNPSPADGATLARTNNTVLGWTTNGTTCDYHIWGGSIDLTPPSGSCASFALGQRRGGSYQWQVTAHNSVGATPGPIWHFNIRPYPPSNLTAAAGSSTDVNLSWTKSTDDPDAVDNYHVYRANGTLLATLPAGSSS
ncbi:MAG: peptidoglycan DD-metalloendopeptidase family protein, partial [Rudaea sp.]